MRVSTRWGITIEIKLTRVKFGWLLSRDFHFKNSPLWGSRYYKTFPRKNKLFKFIYYFKASYNYFKHFEYKDINILSFNIDVAGWET